MSAQFPAMSDLTFLLLPASEAFQPPRNMYYQHMDLPGRQQLPHSLRRQVHHEDRMLPEQLPEMYRDGKVLHK